MHRRMAGGAEADKVLRRIRAAFALRQDVVKMLDRLAAQGAPAVLQGGDIVLLACVAFQASVLEVPATNRPVLQLHEGETVVLHRPVRDGQELADAANHAEMRLRPSGNSVVMPFFSALRLRRRRSPLREALR